MPADDFDRGDLPEDSRIEDLIDWMESDDAERMVGSIGERNENGEWETFSFELTDKDGDEHSITISGDDLGDMDWMDFFDWLDEYAGEYDIDYENEYGEA